MVWVGTGLKISFSGSCWSHVLKVRTSSCEPTKSVEKKGNVNRIGAAGVAARREETIQMRREPPLRNKQKKVYLPSSQAF